MAIIYDTYCVYIHTSPSNKAYIGITCQKPEHRWNNGNGYKQHRYLYQAIKKHGWENFKHEIFADGLTEEQACHIETLLINLFQTTDRRYGYNISFGGEVGTKGIKLSQETRRKLSIASTGRKKSDEEKEKIRCKHLGKKLSDDTKKKLHDFNIGKKLPEETKRKISESLKGRIFSKNPVYCIEMNKVFQSSSQAATFLGHPGCGGNILKGCKNPNSIIYGYHWRYYNEIKN